MGLGQGPALVYALPASATANGEPDMTCPRILRHALPIVALGLLVGCTPEVGSKRWCEQLKEKPKGDWSTNEATDYAKHCLFANDDEQK
jgi:hypothetical protein